MVIIIRVAKNITLGKSRKLKNPNSLIYTQMLLASHYNIELCLFDSCNVDSNSRTMKALFMKNGKQFYKTVEIPQLIDNASSGKMFRQFKDCVLVQPFRSLNKLKNYKLLNDEGTYHNWLIPTISTKSFEDIQLGLSQYNGRIIAKAVRSSGGHSIHKIIAEKSGNYTLWKGHLQTKMTELEMVVYWNNLLSEYTYVIQPFIQSETVFGEPCDIRIHCRCGKNGKFFVDLIPRIGSKNGVVSNVHSGGYVMSPNTFFEREFGNESKQRESELLTLGKEFVEYYQGLFPNTRISSLGLDVGWQYENGDVKFYIFELNAYLGDYPIQRVKDIINQFDYYTYLYDKYNLTKHENLIENNEL